VGEVPTNSVMKAEEIHAREMEHYADQEDDDEEKADPESWSLSEAESRKLEDIKRMFLTFEKDGLGTTSLEKHSIELVEGAKVFKDRPYPMSPAKQKVVEDEVDKMLALGVIEESSWRPRRFQAALLHPVRRFSHRGFCLDARKLNEVTVKDAYPLPSIDGILRQERSKVQQSVNSVGRYQSVADPRPYAEIQISGKTVRGLLDSGASVSLLGRGCRELLETLDITWKPYYAQVKTANGATQSILGKVSIPMTYRNVTVMMDLFLCPSLEQELYLGVDFWKSFQIAPEVFELESIQEEVVPEKEQKEEPEPHNLTGGQKQRLQEIRESFLTFEANGLGRTSKMKHVIDLVEGAVPVKDRHYPVSPAVQSLIYEEIDEMLRLGVIEESDSAWSNTITLVRKPGKNRLCLDARKLNKVTVKDAYPQQSIEGIL
ncbi:hypothetical protein KR059_010889, partial [Drosophila kikkawai]